MGRWKLWFVLLLPLTSYVNSKETGQLFVKTIGKEPDVTPICTNATLKTITLILCKIRTERNGGEECSLLYHYGRDFEYECDSRFTFMTKNQTVFLHLTGLTPEDSGNYTCQCSYPGGTDTLHLNLTVEEDEEDEDTSSSTEIPFPVVVIGIFIFVIITGAILGFIHRKIHRRQQEYLTSRPNTELQDIEPYSTFIQRENELYSLATHSYSMCSPERTQI